ncbi:hypothetical protein Pmani_008659 [Petrolisthes manimaculis]|uniref:Uncharacterized protein n=1 Tax=Petrolisthes manimaculis TaxID=1843537 RepID=A0AAE1UJC9_9EUCA|nr:hypothetical protein Pmani_008659 [Petrolisthes manimaculis]
MSNDAWPTPPSSPTPHHMPPRQSTLMHPTMQLELSCSKHSLPTPTLPPRACSTSPTPPLPIPLTPLPPIHLLSTQFNPPSPTPIPHDPSPNSILTPVIPSNLPQDPHSITQPSPATPHCTCCPDLAPQPTPSAATPPPPQDNELAMPPERITSREGGTSTLNHPTEWWVNKSLSQMQLNPLLGYRPPDWLSLLGHRLPDSTPCPCNESSVG